MAQPPVRGPGNSVGSMTESREAGRAIFLNGGSSSGKSTIGRMLQSALNGVWLLIGIDVLIWLLPVELTEGPSGFSVADGEIHRGPAFRNVYEGFQHSVAALCRAGQNVIIDEVLIDGGADQAQWEIALTGIDTVWIGVRCDREVAIARESARGDRPIGIAARVRGVCPPTCALRHRGEYKCILGRGHLGHRHEDAPGTMWHCAQGRATYARRSPAPLRIEPRRRSLAGTVGALITRRPTPCGRHQRRPRVSSNDS